MTKDEAQAVRQVLMQILMQGGEVSVSRPSTLGQSTLGQLKVRAGCGFELTRDGFIAIKEGLDLNRRFITEKGKQFILDMEEP